MGKTLWSLDTCECKLVIEWDSEQALADREHKYSFAQRCDRHVNARPSEVVEDNRTKNFGTAEVARVSGVEPRELVWERVDDVFEIRKATPTK